MFLFSSASFFFFFKDMFGALRLNLGTWGAHSMRSANWHPRLSCVSNVKSESEK